MVGLVASCLGLLPLTANGLPKCVDWRAGWGLVADTPKTNKQTSQMLHYILVVVAPAPGFQTGVGAGAQVGIVIAIAIAAVAKLVAHVGY